MIQARFEAQVDRTPEAVAVSCGREALTYRELDRRANGLARRLRDLGAGPEARVALCLQRTLDLVVALVATVKSGAAYVPLDPEHPADRLAFCLEDSGASILVTDGSVPLHPGPVVALLEARAPASPDRPPIARGPDDLAYVLYTSGSTGVPKGVMVTEGNVGRLFTVTEPWFGFGSEDVWTLFHSCAFDFSVWEMWGALLYGGRLVVVPFALSRSPAEVAELVCREGVTVLNQTPSAFRQVGRALLGREHSLRYVIFGGEALDFASLRPWAARHGVDRPQLVNMYGITETTVHVTYRRLSRKDVEEGRGSLVGEPLPDLEVHLLDPDLRPADEGEIVVAGAGVARGYLNRPELTAARFVTLEGRRAYRSGDRARRTAEGDLEYLGRLDDQVKVRGFRVEPGEIAARLGTHPSLVEAAVVNVGGTGEARLAAYCVAAGEAPAPAELRAWLAARVPEPMVPSAFVFLDSLPLTVNGKLDRAALPPPVEEAAPFLEPATPTERLLQGIWQEVLGVGRVGRADSFLALGGDSLAAARTLARIAAERGVEVSFRAFFQAPTLADLAREVDSAPRAAPRVRPAPLRRDRPLPASAAQRHLWLTWRLDPRSTAYNETLSVTMPEPVEAASLEAALRHLAARHEGLRTTFADLDGQLMQWIHPAPAVSLVVADVSRAPAAERVAEADRLAAGMAATPFDLGRGPLWRCLLVRLGEADFRFYAVVHHILWDAPSARVFVDELERLHRGETLPPLDLQVAEAAAWEADRLAGPGPSLAWWREKLGGDLPVLTLPGGGPRAAAREAVRLGPAASAAARDLARRQGATLFQVLLAAFQALLHRYTGAEDLLLGTVVDRRGAGFEPLIGCFLWPLALRGTVTGDLPFRDLLARARDTMVEAVQHADVPLDRVLEALRLRRQPGAHPLFAVALTLVPRPVPPGRWTWRTDEVFNGGAKFDLGLALADGPEGLAGYLESRADLVDADLVRRMAGHLGVLLEAAAARPETPVQDLPLLTGPEWEELHRWKGGGLEVDRGRCAHDLFEEQARRTPEAVAVVCQDRCLSYGDLDRQANRLAHLLQGLGARPEMPVGMCSDRCPEAVVAFLGILKSGAAWLPLDPAAPPERLAFMVADSGARLLVVQRPLAPRLAGLPVQLLVLEEAGLAAQPDSRPSSPVTPDNLAYVIYTSGSTGRPKGVLVEHRNLVNFIDTFAEFCPLGPGNRLLQFFRFSFDGSLVEMGPALARGATLVMAPQATLMGPRELAALIREQRVDRAILSPSMLALLDEGEVPGLDTVITGGEACSAALVDRWAPGRRFANGYGPTETTCCSSIGWCRAGEGKPSIGRPLPNTEQWVLDARLRPVPVGVPGELCIGGAGVARGYHGHPELTAERFVPDPYSEGRLYRTGDRVKWRPDGTLDFLGRLDTQVKLRGFRIELEEVEAALRRVAGVADAAVALRDDPPGGPRLVAWVVPRGPGPDLPGVQARLRAWLPEYMVPSAFVLLDRLPLSPSGKVDRQALPAPVSAPSPAPAPGRLVERVGALWGEVLGLEAVPEDVPFFELGGHSLALARVQVELRERLGVDLDMPTLLGLETVRKLAAHLARLPGLPAAPGPAPVGRVLPASAGPGTLRSPERPALQEPGTRAGAPPARGGAVGPALERVACREGEVLAAHPAHRVDAHAALRPRLEAYLAARLHGWLLEHGGIEPEALVSGEDIAGRLGVVPSRRPLLDLVLALLAESGDASRVGSRVRLRGALEGRPPRLAREILEGCPAARPLVDLVDDALARLPEALRGAPPVDVRATVAWQAAGAWRGEPGLRALAEEVGRELAGQAPPWVRGEALPGSLPEVVLVEEALPVPGALEALRAGLAQGGTAVLLERARPEAWERLALAAAGLPDGSGTDLESAAARAGFPAVVQVPLDPGLRSGSLGLFVLPG